MLAIALLMGMSGVVLLPQQQTETVRLGGGSDSAIVLTVKNNSRKRVQVWRSGFWPNHRWVLKDQAGNPVLLTELGERGAKRFGSPSRDKNSPLTLLPGASYTYKTPKIDLAFRLAPGSY